jgi:hypothetical protein
MDPSRTLEAVQMLGPVLIAFDAHFEDLDYY